MSEPTPVYLELGSSRVFAVAMDWPGWARSGRTPDQALESLAAYGPRYAKAVASARAGFRAPSDASGLRVVSRVKGGSGTDFGVPGTTPPADEKEIDGAELKRQASLLRACWRAFDAAAAAAHGHSLRKGPRGGGRDLGKIVEHVLEAEAAYLSQLGNRVPKVEGPAATRMAGIRSTALEALEARARSEPLPDPNKVRKPWTPRYFVRRSAWHVLDHAWEIEDRVEDAT
jgi:hypothetical protein